jgi:hypothetical protein
MYLEVITWEAISDERKQNVGSIVLRLDALDELESAVMVDDSIALDKR